MDSGSRAQPNKHPVSLVGWWQLQTQRLWPVAWLGFTKTTQISLERKALCLYHDRKPHVGGADHLLGQPCPTATAAEIHSHRILAGMADCFNKENDSLFSNSQTSEEGLLCSLQWFKNGMSFLTWGKPQVDVNYYSLQHTWESKQKGRIRGGGDNHLEKIIFLFCQK